MSKFITRDEVRVILHCVEEGALLHMDELEQGGDATAGELYYARSMLKHAFKVARRMLERRTGDE